VLGRIRIPVGHVRESMQLTPQNMPIIPTLPGPCEAFTDAVISDWRCPRRLSERHPTAWTLNRVRRRLYVGENQAGDGGTSFSSQSRKNTLAVSDPVHDRDGCFVRTPGERRWQRGPADLNCNPA